MSFYRRYIQPLFFTRRFYTAFAVIIAGFIVSFNWEWMYRIMLLILFFFIALILLDYVVLFLRANILKA